MAMIYGLDCLALGRYSKLAIAEIPKGWAIGCFAQKELFKADPQPTITALLNLNKVSAVRVHLAWKDNHRFSRKDFPAIIKEAHRWGSTALLAKHIGTRFYVSGACEHLLSVADSRELANRVLDALPGITYVNCGQSNISGPNIINEQHGSKAKPPGPPFDYSFSSDGSASEDSDIISLRTKMKESEYFMFWSPALNLRWEANDTTPRDKRKFMPTKELFRSLFWLSSERGEVSLPPKWLWKSHSECHEKPDPRADKPVMICPMEASTIALHNAKGATIATGSRYPQPFGDGRWRYYFPLWGFQIAKRAMETTGSPLLEVWADGKMWGKINPAFRIGGFQQ